jgi:parallel beta-helix repeat protein
MIPAVCGICCSIAFATLATIDAAEETPANSAIVITASTTLEKGAVLGRGVVIRADHVVLDGNGATLEGPGKPGDTKSFTGVGILIEGAHNVTVRNLRVRGFEKGLEATDCRGLLIEGVDASDNYHDPEFGWGDYKRVGGMILTRVSNSVLLDNRANRNWNAIDLWESNDNLIERNDVSHASNVCLKTWTSSRNRVLHNNLSWGIRISPGEVHARDSTSVLIESGSNDNTFFRNDITHGGDGIFIRVLNGWVSTGNVFVENDCSYANNNCVESWSPGNTYIRNKANYGSYGFWLGGSDQTVLIGNEAAFNGLPTGNHNAPEGGFGHGGIVIVGGSSSHTVIEGNYCHHNAGAGIVFRGDEGSKGAAWRTHHWIVQSNRLEDNRWGIWGAWGDWIRLSNNTYARNAEPDSLTDVNRLEIVPSDPAVTRAPTAVLCGPSRAAIGEEVVFDASSSSDPAGRPLSFRWDLGGSTTAGPIVRHRFDRTGFHRVGVSVDNGVLADLAWRDFIVTGRVATEIGTEGQASSWGFELQGNAGGQGKILFDDDADCVAGRTSLRFQPNPYPGMYATAIFPGARDAAWNLKEKTRVSFWIKFENSNIPGFQEPGPVLRFLSADGELRLQPSGGRNLLVSLPHSEARWSWLAVEIPLAGSEAWERTVSGKFDIETVKAFSMSLDSWGGDPFTIWLDGFAIE